MFDIDNLVRRKRLHEIQEALIMKRLSEMKNKKRVIPVAKDVSVLVNKLRHI